MSDTNLEGGCCRNTLLSNLVRFHRARAWRPNGAIVVWLTCEFRLAAVASMTQRHRRKTRLSFQARLSSNMFKYRMYKSYQIFFHLMQTIRDCAQLQKFLASICFKPVLQCCTQRKRFLEPHSRLQSRQNVSNFGRDSVLANLSHAAPMPHKTIPPGSTNLFLADFIHLHPPPGPSND